jgi:hypothetical protein
MEKSLDLGVAFGRAQEVIKKYASKEISLIQLVQGVVVIIEEYAKEVAATVAEGVVSGKDKKKIAVSILNAAIDIPFVPEMFEEIIIGFLVDWVVDLLNKTGWVKI